MSIISYRKTKYILKCLTEEELIARLEMLIQPSIPDNELVIFPNSKKLYTGMINKNSKKFLFYKNNGGIGPRITNIIVAKGHYRITSEGTEVEITYRPEYFVFLLYVLPIAGYIIGRDFLGPVFLALIIYVLSCVLPFNYVALDMQSNVQKAFKQDLVEEIPLTAKWLRF